MQGTKNSDLTERGRAQALAMGRTLCAELARAPGPTIFLRSPLGRVRETSEIIGRELGLDPAEWRDDPRLAELGYGQWEGFSWQEIEATHPTALTDWRADPHGYCAARAAKPTPSCAGARKKCWPISWPRATRTVVVGHGVSGAVLRGINLGLDAKAMFVLEKPQDAFFRLLAGVEERISCG